MFPNANKLLTLHHYHQRPTNEMLDIVLVSAGTGLVFTSWEGTQPTGLTQTSQTNAIFNTMPHHAWYLSGGAGWKKVVAALCIPCFVYSFYQWCCCYCSLPLLFSQTIFIPTHKFCLFLLILLPIPLGGEEGASSRMVFDGS